jgi:hypothetical protein
VIQAARIGLGRRLVALGNIFNRDWIVIGGGIAKLSPMLIRLAEAEVTARAMRSAGGVVQIIRTEFDDRVGVLGLAALLTAEASDAGTTARGNARHAGQVITS